MHCQVCKENKNPDILSTRESSIYKGHQLIVCPTCKENKLEPRWLVVVVARTVGHNAVKEQIHRKLYLGVPIGAEEIVP